MVLGFQKVLCSICNTEHLVEVIQEEKVVEYKKQTISYWDVHLRCLNAKEHNEFYTDEQKKINQISIIDQYRKNNNLLLSSEIVQIREHYNLTTQELSVLLGWKQDLIYLYENTAPQSHYENDILLKIINNPSFLYHRLKRDPAILINKTKRAKLELQLLKEISEKQDFFED